MKNFLILSIIVLLLGVGAYIVVQSKTSTKYMAAPTDTVNYEANSSPTAMIEPSTQTTVKEFTLDAFEFGYDKEALTINAGDTVKITLTNSGKMPHDWVLDEFNAKTKQITNGKSETITFVADAAGEYEYYCSVGNHRAMGMKGVLTVK